MAKAITGFCVVASFLCAAYCAVMGDVQWFFGNIAIGVCNAWLYTTYEDRHG